MRGSPLANSPLISLGGAGRDQYSLRMPGSVPSAKTSLTTMFDGVSAVASTAEWLFARVYPSSRYSLTPLALQSLFHSRLDIDT